MYNTKGLKMATLIKSKIYFTNDFANLQASRKVEVIMQELMRLAQHADVDSTQVINVINELDALRQAVAK